MNNNVITTEYELDRYDVTSEEVILTYTDKNTGSLVQLSLNILPGRGSIVLEKNSRTSALMIDDIIDHLHHKGDIIS